MGGIVIAVLMWNYRCEQEKKKKCCSLTPLSNFAFSQEWLDPSRKVSWGIRGRVKAATNMSNHSLPMGRDRPTWAGFCLGMAPASAIMHLGKNHFLEVCTQVHCF